MRGDTFGADPRVFPVVAPPGDQTLRTDRPARIGRAEKAPPASGGRKDLLAIEVSLAGAVVRIPPGMDDASRLTEVLRAIRASASRA
jgi:hypothetical protein